MNADTLDTLLACAIWLFMGLGLTILAVAS